ncbi:MAG: N-acetylmuramoyl-L-alanine amidase [Candidatus Wallbacteria bacterium]|nr:N-acetylmuramoyl-L-alanine amidase [Candidatus Wallbacteria bacterium]
MRLPALILLIILFPCVCFSADNVMTWGSASILDQEVVLNFDIGWKKNYRVVSDPEESYIYFDFPRVAVEKTRVVKFMGNEYIEKIKIGQYDEETARIVVYLKSRSSDFKCNSYFKVIDKKTNFIIGVTRKDPIGEIIQEHSFVVIVDAGHGGIDPGCVSPRGYKEKNVVLSLAKKIRDEFNGRNLGIMILTREDDVFLSLDERIKRAVDGKGCLFISLHVDSYPSRKSVRGAGIYYLSQRGASDQRAEILAQKENSSDQIGEIKLAENQEVFQILYSLKQTESIKRSATFTGLLKEKMEESRINVHGVLQAGFRVLKIPDMPAVLVEAGFFSNSIDERLLMNDSHHKRLAKSVVDAVEEYLRNWWKKKY